jgi:hypothetical protein
VAHLRQLRTVFPEHKAIDHADVVSLAFVRFDEAGRRQRLVRVRPRQVLYAARVCIDGNGVVVPQQVSGRPAIQPG